jgi:hypothetical protein
MSQDNSVGANTNYPMANIKPYGYAVPKNVPISQNVFQPDGYQNLDPYTGEQKFAGGGLAALHFKSGGAFISKLKPVTAPKKTAPKLADTKKLESEIKGLEKYGSYDDQMGKFNDLGNQIKDRQADKQNKAKELAERQKSFNEDVKRMKAEQANRAKEINNEYAGKLKDFNAETAAELRAARAKKAAPHSHELSQGLCEQQLGRLCLWPSASPCAAAATAWREPCSCSGRGQPELSCAQLLLQHGANVKAKAE